ncbi:MAG: tetraacyldisaccharide 4'-kinase [Chthonomonadaceae bacterium]|nr:tetraacyldisaccharide 4'-kinase [Chthonomonadaceae bacterium]
MSNEMESIWRTTDFRALGLSPLSGLYALGWWCYQGTYALGLQRAYKAKIPVITVGNLVVGGSGKTPLAQHIAAILASAGKKVVLGMSGYGSPRAKSASLAPGGELDPWEWGDEPAMVRTEVPELTLIVGRDRVAAAKIAEEKFAHAVLVMDDGFQHLRLRQDIALVFDEPRANMFCLPAGPYREPRRTGRSRARTVIPNDMFRVQVSNISLEQVHGPTTKPCEVDLVCAVARPERVVSTLSQLGHKVVSQICLPDHDQMRAKGLLDGIGHARPLVMTRKDWVKVRLRQDLGDKAIFLATRDLVIEPKQEFTKWLTEAIGV